MSKNNSIRIAKNTLILYIRMIVLLAIRLYTSRIVLATLGIEDYGIYNIVGGIIIMFSFFNNAMSNATMRFLAIDIGKNNFNQLKRTFSMSVNVHIGIALIIILLAETIGLWFLNSQLNIPEDRIKAANWVYQFSIATFILNTIRVPYHSIIIAHEKMSFYAYLSIIESILKLSVVFLLENFGYDKLIFYGFLILIVAVLVLIIYIAYCVKTFKSTHYSIFWDKDLFNSLISFSGWTLFGSFANVGSRQGTNILLNIFFDVTVNAAMGIAFQVNNAINGFVQNFQTAFRPQIIKSFASGDEKYLINLIHQTSKYSYYLLYFISLPILLNTNIILQLWLKEVPTYTSEFVIMIICISLIGSLSGPFWMAIQAIGKIRKYQILISLIILSNVWTSYSFLKYGANPISILWIRLIIAIISQGYRIYYLRSLIAFPIKEYVNKVLLKISLVTITTIVGYFTAMKFQTAKDLSLVLNILLCLIITSLCIYFIGLDSKEKKILITYASKFIHIKK